MAISHYTVTHVSGDGSKAVTEITDRARAWKFMHELEAMGVPGGFPQAVRTR